MARKLKIKAFKVQDASRIYCEKRDASGKGASSFPNGEWNGMHISYNGKVWESADWPNARLVYSPYCEAA